MLRRILIAVVFLVVFFVFAPAISPKLALLVSRVPFAWVDYLIRTLPNVTVNWSGIGMVALSSAIALTLGHSICAWLYGQMASGASKTLPSAWPVRWTFALYAGFCLLFVVVITASGLARTTTWFFQLEEPLYRARSSYYAEMRQVEGWLATAALECKSDVTQMRAYIFDGVEGYVPLNWEEYDILWFPGPSNKLHAAIFYPRDPEGQQRVGFKVFGAESSYQEYTMDQLPTVISELERASQQRAMGL